MKLTINNEYFEDQDLQLSYCKIDRLYYVRKDNKVIYQNQSINAITDYLKRVMRPAEKKAFRIILKNKSKGVDLKFKIKAYNKANALFNFLIENEITRQDNRYFFIEGEHSNIGLRLKIHQMITL